MRGRISDYAKPSCEAHGDQCNHSVETITSRVILAGFTEMAFASRLYLCRRIYNKRLVNRRARSLRQRAFSSVSFRRAERSRRR